MVYAVGQGGEIGKPTQAALSPQRWGVGMVVFWALGKKDAKCAMYDVNIRCSTTAVP
jgi:hypothetical protein